MLKTGMQKQLQISGILIAVGLIIELSTLFSSRPTAFLIYITLSGMLFTSGILLYLYSLVTADKKTS